MSLELKFGAQDVRVLDEQTAWSGHFSMRRLTLQHRRFAGGWSDPLVREVFERGDGHYVDGDSAVGWIYAAVVRMKADAKLQTSHRKS